VVKVKRKLQKLGFTLLNPLEWYLDQLPARREEKENKN
jgi:hypothetical protein